MVAVGRWYLSHPIATLRSRIDQCPDTPSPSPLDLSPPVWLLGCFNTLVFFTTLEPGRVEGVSDDGDVKMRGINEVQPIGCLFAEVDLDLSTDYWNG